MKNKERRFLIKKFQLHDTTKFGFCEENIYSTNFFIQDYYYKKTKNELF